MDENGLNFEHWWWLENQKKRLARTKRIRATRRQLAEWLIRADAIIHQLEQEQARKKFQPEWLRPKKVVVASKLVRDLGLQDKVLQRSFHFERADLVNEKNRTLSLTVSSDSPYERAFGTEILDHAPNSIRMGRMLKGAPLLFNHQPDNHLGRIMSAHSDGRRLHVEARFGRSALARDKYQDVVDGILKEASIGYVIHDMTEKPRGIFRAMDWEPYESSLVTVPADVSVGVGR